MMNASLNETSVGEKILIQSVQKIMMKCSSKYPIRAQIEMKSNAPRLGERASPGKWHAMPSMASERCGEWTEEWMSGGNTGGRLLLAKPQ